MRILYWPRVFWPQIGGVEVIAARLLPAMRERGYEFAVIASHSSLDLPDESVFDGIPVYRFHFSRALAERDLSQVFEITDRIAGICAQFAPGLVHVNYWEPSLFFQLRSASVAAPPLLVSFRGPPPEQDSGNDTVFGRAMRAASWVTAVSGAALDRIRELAPAVTARSSLLRNGLPLPALAPAPLCFNPPGILCVARLVPEKGIDLALHALAQLVRPFPALRLTIAGDGPERARLESLARELGVGDVVRFLGWVAPDQVAELMNEATIVVVPSRWEGLPGVAIQAAQMARPLVATKVGGLPEIVLHGQAGLLVDEEDPSALASAVASLLRNPAWAEELGEAARRHARNAFDWRTYLDAHESLYRRLIAEGEHADTADVLAPH